VRNPVCGHRTYVSATCGFTHAITAMQLDYMGRAYGPHDSGCQCPWLAINLGVFCC